MDPKAPQRTVTPMSDDRNTASTFEELTRDIAKEFAERQRATRTKPGTTGKIGAVVGVMTIGGATTLIAGLGFHPRGAVVGTLLFVSTVAVAEFLLRTSERGGLRND